MAFVRGVLRAMVVALVVALASSGALPVWARLVGVEAPHVCHCSAERHDCVCARCHTDPDAAMYLSTESLEGRCGDDEMAFGGKTLLAVLPSPTTVAPATASLLPAPVSVRPLLLPRAEPPRPPPRIAAIV